MNGRGLDPRDGKSKDARLDLDSAIEASIEQAMSFGHGMGEEIMTRSAATLPATASIAEAAALMAAERVDQLEIVGAHGGVGIVTALDLVTWLAHQDGFPLRPKVAGEAQRSALARRERMVRGIAAALDGAPQV